MEDFSVGTRFHRRRLAGTGAGRLAGSLPAEVHAIHQKGVINRRGEAAGRLVAVSMANVREGVHGPPDRTFCPSFQIKDCSTNTRSTFAPRPARPRNDQDAQSKRRHQPRAGVGGTSGEDGSSSPGTFPSLAAPTQAPRHNATSAIPHLGMFSARSSLRTSHFVGGSG